MNRINLPIILKILPSHPNPPILTIFIKKTTVLCLLLIITKLSILKCPFHLCEIPVICTAIRKKTSIKYRKGVTFKSDFIFIHPKLERPISARFALPLGTVPFGGFQPVGEQVYETTDVNQAWVGDVNGGDYYANEGGYTWLIEGRKAGAFFHEKGQVLLLR